MGLFFLGAYAHIRIFNIRFIYQFGFLKFFNQKIYMVQMDNSCHNMISLPIIQFFEHKL